MVIALDYDGTFTADPALWNDFIRLALCQGHEVKIVTMRYPHETVEGAPVDVVYTSRKAKKAAFAADIWIDDAPHWVYMDSPA
jgi:hypothetical protein